MFSAHAISTRELNKYIQMPILRREENPLSWWKENKIFFPNLYEIAKRRFCIMATSVPYERIFSKQGEIIIEKRTLLTSDKVSKILFLHTNLK